MSFAISALSIIMIYLMGNKWKYAPILGICNQILWVIYVVNTQQYGLLIGVVGYLFVHIINSIKWIKEGTP